MFQNRLLMKEFGPVAYMGKRINAHRILVGKPEGKRPLGRPLCQWEGNINMACTVLGRESMAWLN